MISKIIIPKAQKTIPGDFTLELSKMTVITGENNVGKTNFINEIFAGNVAFQDESGEVVLGLEPEIVFISAENIKPADSECKTSAKTSGLVENLANLFSNLEIDFELTNEVTITDSINDLIDRANTNIERFTGKKDHVLEVKHNDKLDAKVIIQALIKDITGYEGGEKRKLEELGQGTQRIIVVSILKAYVDMMIERGIITDKPVLILFDEPEIYLHPRLKRTLNATLEEIAEQPNHQVVIITHDPYFVFQGLGVDKKVVSFEKGEDGFTVRKDDNVISGIEDELLFVLLYSKLEGDMRHITEIEIDGIKDRVYLYKDGTPWERCTGLQSIRHQIHHRANNPNTFERCLLETDKTPEVANYYTQNELAEAIEKMSKKLSEIN